MMNACPIFDLPGVGPMTVYPDLMHVKHMGTDVYFYASVLYVLVFEVFQRFPMETAMTTIWAQLRLLYDNSGTKYSNLKLSTFLNLQAIHNTFPKLKGKAAEAPDLRCLHRFAVYLSKHR